MAVTSLPETAAAQAASRSMPVVSPISGEVVGQVPRLTADKVIGAVRSARAAQVEWAARPFKERAAIIIRFHDAILKQSEDLFEVLHRESGKSYRDAFVELFAVACEARYYAYNGGKWLRPQRIRPAIPVRDRSQVVYHPWGVIGSISPWNFPFILTMGDTIPALLAGNAVVLKPSSKTPLTALWGRERLVEAGLPPELFQVVSGAAREIADVLVAHTDYIMFTGSTETGRELAVKAARRLIPYSMELGGKNAMIVLPGSDLNHAARVAIEGSFNNAGQVCISFERLYVHDAVYEPFKKLLVEKTAGLRLGAQGGFDVDMGSMIDAEQAHAADAHVREAAEMGATVLQGGQFRPDLGPAFYEPTLLEHVRPEMAVYGHETFGPVLSLYRVGSAEEAVRLANDSPYGLHYGVYSGDLRLGERLAAQLQAGSVCVNDSYMSWGALDGPMGGFKQSGVGRRHGPEGIRKYTQPQTIVTNQTRWQIGTTESALALNGTLAKWLIRLLGVWRRVPFVR